MLNTIWKWLYRFAIALGVLVFVFSVLFVVSINRPSVIQSNGETDASTEANAATISGSLPPTAKRVQYCSSTVALGGRLLLYRFSAPLNDLHAHAQAEFAAHWDKPQLKKTSDVNSPITEQVIQLYKSAFGVDATWMLAPRNASGTLYESTDGQSSHRPTIFVDEVNYVLYFQMTD